MDQRVAHLVSVVDTYRKENSDLANKLTQISQQVDLQSSLRGAQRGHDEQQGRLTNVLMTRVGKLERRLEAALADKEAAEQALEESCERYERQLSALSGTAQALSATERQLRGELAAREREACERVETIKELTEALGAMVSRVKQDHVPRAAYDSLSAEHERAAEDLAAARAEVASAQTQLSEAKAANASLAERLEEAQGDAARAYEALRTDLVPRADLEESRSRCAALQSTLQEETVSIDAFTDIVAKYDELEAAVQREYCPVDRYEEVCERLRESEERCARLHASAEAASTDRDEIAEELGVAERRLSDTEERLDRCRAEMKGLLDRIDELETTYAAAHTERNHYREVYERGCDQTALLQKEKAALLIQLGNSKAVISRAQQGSRGGSPAGLGASGPLGGSMADASVYTPPRSSPPGHGDLSNGVKSTNAGNRSADDGGDAVRGGAAAAESSRLRKLQKESDAWRRRYERSQQRSADWRAVAKGLVSQRLEQSMSMSGAVESSPGDVFREPEARRPDSPGFRMP